MVNELLRRSEYADFWALKWSDLLRVDREKLGHKRAFAFYRRIRDLMADGTPLDRFAREIVTAEGPLDEVGPANFFKVASQPGEAAGSLRRCFSASESRAQNAITTLTTSGPRTTITA